MYHRNIFGSSSKVLGNLRKSSDIFGNFRKFSENVRERSSGLRDNLRNLRKSSEGGRKSSENHQKRRHQYVYIINREYYTLARRYEFYVLVARAISHSFAALTREILFLPLEHKIHIISPPCNILYIYVPECKISLASCLNMVRTAYSVKTKSTVSFSTPI